MGPIYQSIVVLIPQPNDQRLFESSSVSWGTCLGRGGRGRIESRRRRKMTRFVAPSDLRTTQLDLHEAKFGVPL